MGALRRGVMAAFFAGAAAVMPGCIVGEIRDDLKGANEKLVQVQQSLGKLDQTNERIAATNAQLDHLQKQLAVLESVNTSLSRLDSHLASVRATIAKLDSTIPFLDLGSGDVPPPEVPAASAVASGSAGAAAPSGEAGAEAGTTSAPETAAREGGVPTAAAAVSREPLIGTWIRRFPDDRWSLVIFADGRSILARTSGGEPSTTAETPATWTREGQTLRFTPVGATGASGGEAPGGAKGGGGQKPGAAAGTTGAISSIEVLSVSGRTATVRVDGAFMVFARP